MASAINAELQAPLNGLEQAWKHGDGAAFAEQCTEDVDFINILGMHVQGRPAVAELHNKIFNGPYRGSTVTFTIESARAIGSDAVLAIVPGHLEIPEGPVKGAVLTVASVLLLRDGSEWKIANFHNTRRDSTQPSHLSVMRDAVK